MSDSQLSNIASPATPHPTPTDTPILASTPKPTNFRWIICGLLLYATTINYIDRSILNAMAPDLQKIIGWHDYQFGLINAAFTLAYAIGFLVMGRLIDALGTRLGYAIALCVWTISAFLTIFTKTPFQFGMARFGLGLGEAGNFPAAIKTVAEWFPQRQRATATGVFNAGSNVGAILAPIIALTLVPRWGWQAAFIITPVLAAIWVSLWLVCYRPPNQHPKVNQAERDLINDAPTAGGFPVMVNSGNAPAAQTTAPTKTPAPVKWRSILPHRQTWAFMIGKFLTDPIWWFYLFWSGKFFHDNFGADLKGLALPLIYVYILADVGSIAGGWLSSMLIKRGWSPNAARKTAMAICAGLILPVIAAPLIPSTFPGGMWIAATLIGVAAAAHQGFSANIFTTTSDMFPKRAVSSVVGLGGLAGALGGMIMQAVSGVIKEVTNSYVVMFIIAGSVYVLAVLLVHILAPRLKPVTDEQLETTRMPRLVTAILSAVLGFAVGVPLSFLFQNHSLSLTMQPAVHDARFGFGEYFASILSGDIFKSIDHAQLVPTFLSFPFIAAAVFAIVAIVLHSLIRASKQTAR